MPGLTVAQYLAHRLHDLGVEHLFGVPGDFSLTLLDRMLEAGLQTWAGSANELNAGYAADGYARTRGLAAVVTTFGVGELSLINAVAGAYAENVPLVQITGAPPRAVAARAGLTHHTLGDGDFGHYTRAFREVTAAAAVLTPEDAAAQIDGVLAVALHQLRPVYLTIPADVVTAPIPAERLAQPLPPAPDHGLGELRRRAAALLADARSVAVIAGNLVERTRSEAGFRALVNAAASPAVTLLSCRGPIAGDDPHFAGLYCGELGTKRAALAVDSADVLLHVGTLMTDAVSGMFTHRDDPAHSICLYATEATVAGERIGGVPFAAGLRVLTELAREAGGWPRTLADTPAEGPVAGQTLDQETLWAHVARWLPAGYRVVTDIGTASWGVAAIELPAGTDVVISQMWAAIGYALPATLGCALAAPERRPVLVIGDGAAQMTVQELGAFARYGAAPIVLLLDNAGYSIERAIQSPAAVYNDIPAWDWCALARALAPAAELFTASPTTPAELDGALAAAAARPDRMALLHIRLDPLDFPEGLRALAERQDAERQDTDRQNQDDRP